MTQPLHDVHGHAGARRDLARARMRGTLPSALLVHGAPGVGKQRLALWTAQLMLCEAPGEAGPCGSCRQCHLVLRLEHPDVHWHFPLPRPKGASTPEKLADALEEARATELAERRERPLRPVDDAGPTAHYLAAARTLRRRAQSGPAMAREQVFIVAEAERLVPQESSPEAANALLKLLEEPPSGTRFILTSNEPGRLLPTIRSRCLPLHLPPLTVGEVETFLRERIGADGADAPDADAIRRAARLSRGSIGRALGFLPDDGEPGPLDTLRLHALDLVRGALGPPSAPFKAGLDFRPSGARGLLDLFDFVEAWVRDLVAVAAGAPEAVHDPDYTEELEELVGAAGVDPAAGSDALEVIETARDQASGNVNPQLVVPGLMVGLRSALIGEAAPAG